MKDPAQRLHGIDWLRGIVMVLMALDHARDYFGDIRVDPTDLDDVGPAMFLTRWITHFCAPVFVLLAGTGAFLYGRRHPRGQLSLFLLTRGLWLVVLEFTVVHFGWWGTFSGSFWLLQVIAAIGFAMIGLAALVWLPHRAIAAVGLLIVFGHNFLDPIDPAGFASWLRSTVDPAVETRFDGWPWLWVLLHEDSLTNGIRPIMLGGGNVLVVIYPLLPWFGVMALGYALGPLFLRAPDERRRLLLRLGLGAVALFVLLRATDLFGNFAPWQPRVDLVGSVLAFLNCQKYPPSLVYLLMTLGPALVALALLDREPGPVGRALVVFGRVPLFYYVAHVFALQYGSRLLYLATEGQALSTMPAAFSRSFPPWYGHRLWVVYVAWLAVVVLLYVPCRRYAELKRRNRSWWLSYL